MVRPEVARTKIARAAAWLDDAEEILRRPREEYLADAGWAPPDEAGAAFDVLADAGVIDRTLADALRLATGLRNRIAHGYGRVEHRRIYDEAPEGLASLSDLTNLARVVARVTPAARATRSTAGWRSPRSAKGSSSLRDGEGRHRGACRGVGRRID